MAIHLNLYHEIQKQERQRRRDPLKLGMIAMLFVAAAFMGYYFVRMASVRGVNDELVRLQNEWRTTEPKFAAAKTREAEIAAVTKITDTLVQSIESRFYWAPLLDKVLASVPREVQLVRLDGDMTDKVKPGALSVSGVSSGTEPRKVAEDLRTRFVNKLSEKYKNVTSTFKTLEDSDQTVKLDGKALSTAMFGIQFQIASVDVAAAAPAAPERKPRAPKQ